MTEADETKLVEQCDRDATNAARAWCDDMDEPEMAQAFARHRIEALARVDHTEGWQPIETAPRDGSWFLGFWPLYESQDRFSSTSWFDDGDESRFLDDGDCRDGQPSHWRPLPPPPATGEG